MKTGIILEVNKKFVTLLTPEGEFLKAQRRKQKYKIGQEILFKPVKPKTFSFFRLSAKKASIVSAVAVVTLSLTILPGMLNNEVSAYMTIDINPSIELAIDDHLKVIELTGLNPEGKDVVDQISKWDKKNVKTVTDKIVKKTKALGYLQNHKEIIVSTTLMEKNNELDKNLRQEISKTAALVPEVDMKVINATQKDRNNAVKEGVSTGRYIEKQQAELKKRKAKNASKKTNNNKQQMPTNKTGDGKKEKFQSAPGAKSQKQIETPNKKHSDYKLRMYKQGRGIPPQNHKPHVAKKPGIKTVAPLFKHEGRHHENHFRDKRNEHDNYTILKPNKPKIQKKNLHFTKGKYGPPHRKYGTHDR